MIPRRPLGIAAGFLFCLLVFVESTSRAHSDPRGDVHPEVIAREDRFEVYFENNLESEDSKKAYYRAVFKLDGTEITRRERVEGNVPASDGFEEFLILGADGIPAWEAALDGGTEESPRFGGKARNHRFLVPLNHNSDCQILGWPSKSRMVLRFSPAAAGSGNNWPFYLGLFDVVSGRLEIATRIGNPGRIYEFADTSAVVAKGEEYFIAWVEMRFIGRTIKYLDGQEYTFENKAYRVVLTRWNPGTGSVTHFDVGPVTSYNVALSIAAQGQHLMVAWHDYGRVRTRVVDLTNETFVKALPLVERDEEALSQIVRGLR